MLAQRLPPRPRRPAARTPLARGARRSRRARPAELAVTIAEARQRDLHVRRARSASASARVPQRAPRDRRARARRARAGAAVSSSPSSSRASTWFGAPAHRGQRRGQVVAGAAHARQRRQAALELRRAAGARPARAPAPAARSRSARTATARRSSSSTRARVTEASAPSCAASRRLDGALGRGPRRRQRLELAEPRQRPLPRAASASAKRLVALCRACASPRRRPRVEQLTAVVAAPLGRREGATRLRVGGLRARSPPRDSDSLRRRRRRAPPRRAPQRLLRAARGRARRRAVDCAVVERRPPLQQQGRRHAGGQPELTFAGTVELPVSRHGEPANVGRHGAQIVDDRRRAPGRLPGCAVRRSSPCREAARRPGNACGRRRPRRASTSRARPTPARFRASSSDQWSTSSGTASAPDSCASAAARARSYPGVHVRALDNATAPGKSAATASTSPSTSSTSCSVACEVLDLGLQDTALARAPPAALVGRPSPACSTAAASAAAAAAAATAAASAPRTRRPLRARSTDRASLAADSGRSATSSCS